MRQIALLVFLLASATTLTAQINDSEVWVGSLDMSGGRFVVSNLVNISKHPGYDNQPAFFPDGRLVFTSQIAVLDDTGHAVQAVIHDFASGTSTPVSGALGFSPTPAGGWGAAAAARGEGVAARGLGERARADGDERRGLLQPLRRPDMGALHERQAAPHCHLRRGDEGARDDGGRRGSAPIRIPGKRAVTFVAVEPFPAPEGEAAKSAPPRKLFLRQLELDNRLLTTLTAIPFPTSGSHVWTSRGTLLMASAHTIYEWNPAHPDEWRPVAQFDDPELQGLTRIALSPRGDRIALVSTPRDETIIRDSRAASNEALAAHNAAAFAQVLKDDVIVTAASGKLIQGRTAMREEIETRWKAQPDLVFVRTPATVEISRSDPSASERGTWTGHATTTAGPADWRGDYMAAWRKTISLAGLPSWTIASEVFVALDCNGTGCGGR